MDVLGTKMSRIWFFFMQMKQCAVNRKFSYMNTAIIVGKLSQFNSIECLFIKTGESFPAPPPNPVCGANALAFRRFSNSFSRLAGEAML